MATGSLQHQYVIEIHKREPSARLAVVSVSPDFSPALEWATFEAVRKDPTRPVVLDTEAGRIEPCWSAALGRPYLSALRAVVSQEGQPPVAFDIPLSYFHSLAQAASPALVDSGRLQEGELFDYFVLAYATQAAQPAGQQQQRAALAFSVKPVAEVIEVDEQSLDELLAETEPCGADDADQMPVLLPQQVLDEAVALMHQAGAAETGGVLIGHLRRDTCSGELFLEVTAQIPARHAQQELTRLTYTPDTWAAVDAAISLRGRREMHVGWWHTHPSSHWCDDCRPETRQKCQISGKLSGDFFSAHDVALHRTVFPRAFNVALVLSDGCENSPGPTQRLYGWRQGMIRPRGFHVLGAAPAVTFLASQRGHADVSSS